MNQIRTTTAPREYDASPQRCLVIITIIGNKQNNIIQLFENVKIFRDEEIITGDYAKINTFDESYKITSKESKKVKVLLNKADE